MLDRPILEDRLEPAYRGPHGCSVSAALGVIGGRWKPLILFKLMERGPLRSAELRRLLPGVSQKVATAQLRELEEDGVIARRVENAVPPRVAYGLTDYGATLKPILVALRDWGAAHRGREEGPSLQTRPIGPRPSQRSKIRSTSLRDKAT